MILKNFKMQLVLLLSIMTVFTNSLNAATPSKPLSVVVSITPFYSLVSSLTQGTGSTLTLLVKPGASPHHYALRPSEIQGLENADVIIWAGPNLESFLAKPLNNLTLKPSVRIIELDKTPELQLWPERRSAAFEPHQHGKDGHEHHGLVDMHFWLDPNNALKIIDYLVKEFESLDPRQTRLYEHNAKDLKQQINKMDNRISENLQKVKHIPFIVFHDAYQYFERHYDLSAVGAITLNPEVPPSAQRIQTIQNTLTKTKAVCVFSEPQFEPKLVQSLAKDTGIRTGELDPIGLPFHNGHPTQYPDLLLNLSNAFKNCLSGVKTPNE